MGSLHVIEPRCLKAMPSGKAQEAGADEVAGAPRPAEASDAVPRPSATLLGGELFVCTCPSSRRPRDVARPDRSFIDRISR
jgi:hypothetical protein